MKGPPELTPYRGETYYGLPSMKPSHYRFRIGTAFSLLGIGAGALILSTLVDILGVESKEERDLVKAGRYMGLAGSVAAPLLYIMDLHTPQRWFNMLRIFRKSSMMSIGSWTITGMGALSVMTLVSSILEDSGYRQAGKWGGRVFEIPAAFLAALASVYKGSEIEETNTPLWASASPLLSAFLASSDAAGAASALSLVSSSRPELEQTRKGLDAFAMLAGIAELLIYAQMRKKWKEKVSAKPIQGAGLRAGWSGGAIALGVIAPVIVRALEIAGPGKEQPKAAASLGSILGSLLIPSLLIIAGNRTARTPQDYFTYTEKEQPRRAARGGLPPESNARALLLGAASLGLLLLKRRSG